MNTAELLDQLRSTEETLLLELLGLTSTDLVDAFVDKIVENEEYIRRSISYD